MLERDYFIRLIQEFTAALALFLEKKKEDRKDDDMKELYRQYVGDYDLIRNLSFEEILAYAHDQWKEEERMDRLEMLAELLYAESTYKSAPLKSMLQEKSFLVFDYVDERMKSYSIRRKQMMQQLQQELGNAGM